MIPGDPVPWFRDLPVRDDVHLFILSNEVTHTCRLLIDGRDGRGLGGGDAIFGSPTQALDALNHQRRAIEIYGGYTMLEAIG